MATKRQTAARVRQQGKSATKSLNAQRNIAAAARQEKRILGGGAPLLPGKGNRTVIHKGGGPTVINSES